MDGLAGVVARGVPAGRWAAAVSGGADSVAMLRLCAPFVARVVHLDHETRGEASAGDAAFVAELAARLGIPCTVARRSERETVPGPGTSTHYRELRLGLYREVVTAQGLDGVLLAHHADDQAETVMQRLLRGSSFVGLGGMEGDARVGGVRLVRPMLGVRRGELRGYLGEIGQGWREDASNATDAYGRNRVRRVLEGDGRLVDALLELGAAARAYREGLEGCVPEGGEALRVGAWSGLPGAVAWIAARGWLGRYVEGEELSGRVVERFLAWVSDAAGPAVMELPGGVRVRRRRGVVGVE